MLKKSHQLSAYSAGQTPLHFALFRLPVVEALGFQKKIAGEVWL